MKRVVITGASGFVGAPVTRALLSSGWEVHALSSDPPRARPPGVRWHHVDLLGPTPITPVLAEIAPSHLVHLAWDVTPRRYCDSVDNVAWAAASLQLVHAFATVGGRRVVAAGTCAEYAWIGGACVEDETPIAPRSPYAIAKDAVRRVITSLGERGALSVCWARLFFLYGPGERPGRLVSGLASSLLAGRRFPCSDGSHARDYLHVDDAARSLAGLLECETSGAVNVASGHATLVKTIVEEVAAAIGRPDLVGWGERPSPESEPPVSFGDTRRLRAALGEVPDRPLPAGILDTVKWWRALRA